VGVYAQGDCRVCFAEEKFDCRRLRTKESASAAAEAEAEAEADVRTCGCSGGTRSSKGRYMVVAVRCGGRGGTRKGRPLDEWREGGEGMRDI